MKELEPKQQDNKEVHAEAHVPKGTVINPGQMHNGHTLWQLELATGIITEVQYDQVNYHLLSESVRKKVVEKEGFKYVPALNAKNADKKFHKALGLNYPKGFKVKREE